MNVTCIHGANVELRVYIMGKFDEVIKVMDWRKKEEDEDCEEGKKNKGFGQKRKWWWSSEVLRGRQRVKQLCAEKGGNRDSEDRELLISLPINVAF